MKNTLIMDKESSLILAVIAVAFMFLAIGLETVLNVPLKLPGHRAFAGATALLLFAEALAPYLIVVLAGLISLFFVSVTGAEILIIPLWMVSAISIIAINKTKLAHSVVYFIFIGLIFGLLRYLFLSQGFHHTPDLIRIAGHLSFGCLGRMFSLAITRSLNLVK